MILIIVHPMDPQPPYASACQSPGRFPYYRHVSLLCLPLLQNAIAGSCCCSAMRGWANLLAHQSIMLSLLDLLARKTWTCHRGGQFDYRAPHRSTHRLSVSSTPPARFPPSSSQEHSSLQQTWRPGLVFQLPSLYSSLSFLIAHDFCT